MTTMIACVLAGISTTVAVVLWFFVVYRELKTKRNALKSAQYQLNASRHQQIRTRDGPEAQSAHEVLIRSLDIYRQSVALYHETLKKPWNCIPGFLMGFRQLKDENE